MGDAYNVFISWSGERSKWAAEALREWLPIVLQAAKPWMSNTDIDKGSRGLDELGRALEGMKIGIICLTPENLTATWILYEAGALSKTLDAKTRVCTYLLAGLRPQDVKAPLGMFQWTKAEKEDTRKLIHTINKALDVEPVPEANLDALFEGMWPLLEDKLGSVPQPQQLVETSRPPEEMIAEILELSRAAANSRKAVEELDEYVPVMKQLLPVMKQLSPFISEALKREGAPPAPPKTPETVPLRAEPRKTFYVKLAGDDHIKRIEGIAAVEDTGQLFVVGDGGRVVARFSNRVEQWWPEPPQELPDANLQSEPQPPGE